MTADLMSAFGSCDKSDSNGPVDDKYLHITTVFGILLVLLLNSQLCIGISSVGEMCLTVGEHEFGKAKSRSICGTPWGYGHDPLFLCRSSTFNIRQN